MDISVTYERDWGVGWIAAEPAFMQRACHALAHDGGVWLIDPVDGEGLEERIAPLGEVHGVLQLIDRHGRDGAALARRYGVPLLATPFDRVAGAPFEPIAVLRRRRWNETALWWPERRVLVVAEALGTAPYFPASGARVGVHPALRLTPPRALAGFDPEQLLVGHGPPLLGGGVAAAVRSAIERSRREIPRWLAGLPGARRRAREAPGREIWGGGTGSGCGGSPGSGSGMGPGVGGLGTGGGAGSGPGMPGGRSASERVVTTSGRFPACAAAKRLRAAVPPRRCARAARRPAPG